MSERPEGLAITEWLAINLKEKNWQDFFNTSVQIESLGTLEILTPNICADVYSNLGKFIDGQSQDEIRIALEDPNFRNGVYYLSRAYNTHIAYAWEAGENPKPLLEESKERYLKLDQELQITILSYNEAFVGLNEAIQEEHPEKAAADLELVCNSADREITILDMLRRETGILYIPDESRKDFYRERFYIPANFRNLAAQAHLDKQFFFNRSPQRRDGERGDIFAARLLLIDGERILTPERPIPEEHSKTLEYQKTLAAILGNRAYSYLVEAHVELNEKKANGRVFASLMKQFRMHFDSPPDSPTITFLKIVKKDPNPSLGARKEDQIRLPKYFNTEIFLDAAYASVLWYDAKQRVPVWTLKMVSEEQEFYKMTGASKPKNHSELGSLVNEFMHEAHRTSTPDDEAQIVKYTNFFEERGVFVVK